METALEVGNSVNIKRSDGEFQMRKKSWSFCQFRREKTGSPIRTTIILQAISSSLLKVSHCKAHERLNDAFLADIGMINQVIRLARSIRKNLHKNRERFLHFLCPFVFDE